MVVGCIEVSAATAEEPLRFETGCRLLGGSGDLVSKVISPLIGVISIYKYSYLIYNPSY